MNWQRAIEIGLYTALANDATLTALVGGGIYNEYAPAEAALPYVIIGLNSGRESNQQSRRMAWAIHTILGVAEEVDDADAISAAIDGALHAQTLTPGSGWSFTDCKLTTPISYMEAGEHKQYIKRGGNYRTRISEE